MSINCNRIVSCIDAPLGRLLERIARESGSLASAFSQGYRSYPWQRFKRLLADILAECIASNADGVREIYLHELHGGEPANVGELGGKDIDLILVVRDGAEGDVEELERCVESYLENRLREALGGKDPLSMLGIPNIVELQPQKNRGCRRFRYSQPIRIWPPGG